MILIGSGSGLGSGLGRGEVIGDEMVDATGLWYFPGVGS